MNSIGHLVVAFAAAVACACGASGRAPSSAGAGGSGPSASAAPWTSTRVDVGGGRKLLFKCRGAGTPVVLLEAGDNGSSEEWAPKYFEVLGAMTRVCAYDRAGLGESDPPPGKRELPDLVGDFERLLASSGTSGPYVLVASSGGGFIASSFATAHHDQIAGLVWVDVPCPTKDPTPEIVAETAWDNPDNRERRDFLQVEKDAWAARRAVADVPFTILSVDYGADAQNDEERANVECQRGWLALSPHAHQTVVRGAHPLYRDKMDLVIETIAATVRAARAPRRGS